MEVKPLQEKLARKEQAKCPLAKSALNPVAGNFLISRRENLNVD